MTQGKTLNFDFTASDPEHCAVNVVIDGPSAPWFRSSVSGHTGHVEVAAPEVGAWTILLSAHDECGGKRSQRLPLLVTKGSVLNTTGVGNEANCTSEYSKETVNIFSGRVYMYNSSTFKRAYNLKLEQKCQLDPNKVSTVLFFRLTQITTHHIYTRFTRGLRWFTTSPYCSMSWPGTWRIITSASTVSVTLTLR